MAKKRTQAAAGIADGGTEKKKRKAAETATAKTKKLAAGDDDSDFDEVLHDGSPPAPKLKSKSKSKVKSKAASKAVPTIKTLPKRDEVEDMPLVAPGFRHFEGFSDTVRNTEIAALTKSKPDMEQSRKYGFTLKPVIITEGPLAGKTILVVEDTPTFKFLDLPPEIRNMVYSYLIEVQDTTKIDSHKPVGKPRRPVVAGFKYRNHKSSGLIWDKANGKWIGQGRTSYDLLCVSKQVQAETARLLYGETTFTFYNWPEASLFIDTIGSMRRYLRHLQAPDDTARSLNKASTSLKKLGDAVDLQTFSVEHNQVCPEASTRWTLGIDGLVNAVIPLMKVLHKSFATADPPRNVLDLVKVEFRRSKCVHCTAGEGCYNCRIGREHEKKCWGVGVGNCKVVCDERESHCEDLANQVRVKIASALGIKG